MDFLKELNPLMWHKVGSTETCNPPPIDTDIDFILLFPDRKYTSLMKGYSLDGSGHYEPSEGEFSSWRKGKINLICTDSLQFYQRFLTATKVAKHLNLLDKKDRVVLFQAILYGRCPPKPPVESEDH